MTETMIVGPRGEQIQEVWWIDRPANLYQFHVYLVRHHMPVRSDESDDPKDHWAPWSEFLDPDQQKWVMYPEGGAVKPCLILDQRLVTVIAGSERPLELDNASMSEALRKLCGQIVENVMVEYMKADR